MKTSIFGIHSKVYLPKGSQHNSKALLDMTNSEYYVPVYKFCYQKNIEYEEAWLEYLTI